MTRPLLALPDPITPDPCPCGETAYVVKTDTIYHHCYHVECPTCGRLGPDAYGGPDAVREWNEMIAKND